MPDDDDQVGPDPVLVVAPGDDPHDPEAHLYDDSDEGADVDGTPVLSVDGSEVETWGE